MTKHLLGERLFSTDLLFKNFFDTNVGFGSVMDAKPDYPVDVFISDEKLCFDIACVGVDNLTKLDATMKDGLLQITVPKTEEAKSKLITIK